MKRVICLITVFVLCISLACPVLAADFVPSISYKGAPELKLIQDENGNPKIGAIRDAAGNIIGYADEDCLVVTAVSQAESSNEIPNASKDTLLAVYKALSDGSMQLPYDKLSADVDANKMVIRDLFDATWLCNETSETDHSAMVEPEGVVLELTFDLGVSKDTEVYVMTYKNNEWNPIEKVVNNGDGSVTCTFEHLCPIAFSVASDDAQTPPVQTGDNADLTIWVVLLAVSAAAVVLLVVLRRKTAR